MKWQIFESGGWDVCTLNGCGAPDHGRWNKQYNGAIRESFLHLQSAENLDAAGLREKIIHILKSHSLGCKRTCLVKHMFIRGICHDWQAFWSEVLNISEQCGATPSATKKTKTKQKKPLALNLVNIVYWLTIGQKESDRDKNSFRTAFFFPIKDKMLSAINRRHIFNCQWS